MERARSARRDEEKPGVVQMLYILRTHNCAFTKLFKKRGVWC